MQLGPGEFSELWQNAVESVPRLLPFVVYLTATSSTPSPAGSVVSYMAVVDEDNSGDTIVPGSTAVVMQPTAQRFDVLRVPNTALAFRPTPDMLKASGQARLKVASGSPEDGMHDHQGIV